MKIIPLIIVFIIMITGVYANDFTQVNSTVTLWSDVFSGTDYYNAGDANITIRRPFDADISITGRMVKETDGLYYYNFTPNQTGVYYASTKVYNTTGSLIGTISQSFTVVDATLTNAGGNTMFIFIGLIALAFLMVYISFNLSPEHQVFKFILLSVAVLVVFMSTASMVNNNQQCAIVSSGGVNSLACFDNTDSTPNTLFRISTYLLYGFFLYLIMYILWVAVQYLMGKGFILGR